MEGSDYTYIFDDLSDAPRTVKCLSGNTATQVISTCQISIDDSQPLSLRWVPEIVVPVRHPEVLGSSRVSDQLSNTLYWFTGDYWSFNFTRRTHGGRTAELQMTMPLGDALSEPSEVALWSGGLDSLAGLCNRLSADPRGCYTLLGTSSNTILHSTQRQVAVGLREKFPDRIRLVQIPMRLDESTALHKEPSQRSRGFVFMLLGAACAYLAGKRTLHIYENGIGAINLPFRASEVGLDHTRSVHPLSLVYVSNLVKELLGTRFHFENHFCFLPRQ